MIGQMRMQFWKDAIKDIGTVGDILFRKETDD
jgi:hypothetical protein